MIGQFTGCLRHSLRIVSLPLGFLLAASAQGKTADYDLQQAIDEAKATNQSVVEIPAGVHLLGAGGVRLDGAKGLVIEGNGALLLATSRRAPAFAFYDCEEVTLRNVTIDYNPLPFTQGDVVGVDLDGRTVTVKLHAGYPGLKSVENANASFSDARMQLFAGDTNRHKPGAPDYAVASAEDRGDGSIVVHFQDWVGGLDKVEVGDSVTLSSRGAEGICVRTSRDVDFENVTVHTAPNVAFLVRSSDNAGTYRNVRIVPGPRPEEATRDRLMSACADGLNVSFTGRGPIMEGCEFAYQGDDAVNLHGALLPVLRQIDARTYLSAMPWSGNLIDRITREGDEVRFLQKPDYALVGVGSIRAITRTQADLDAWLPQLREIWKVVNVNPASVTFYRVELEKPVAGVEPGMFFEVPASAAPGFVIRDSYFHDNRARGLRIMASNGLILDNRFERQKGCAISLGAEFAFWHEAGWVRNVVVAGNTLHDIGTGAGILSPDSYTLGAISLMARTEPGSATHFEGNRYIVIENNRIDGCSVNAISISCARDVAVRGNRIRNVNTAGSLGAGSARGLASLEPISIHHAEATLSDNIIEE